MKIKIQLNQLRKELKRCDMKASPACCADDDEINLKAKQIEKLSIVPIT
jgi:hypothetical protein